MASVPGYNNTVVCPYNKSHNILKERFQTHLVKCAKSYPNIVLKTCPYNATHLVKESDYEFHVTECDDRVNLDLYRYPIAAPVNRNQLNEPAAPEPVYVPLPDGGENWDDENVASYDPQAYVQNAPVIRQLNVAPRSERRAFREAERLRINQMRQ